MPALPDLATQGYVLAYLADLALTPPQVAAVPPLVSAASDAIRALSGYVFNLWTFDELHTVEPPYNQIFLRQYPIGGTGVSRCATNPTPILSVWNTDPAAVKASAGLTTAGDVLTGIVATGLTLTRFANGQVLSSPVPFTTNMTATALAAAVTAADATWQGLAQNGLGGWPVADLRPPQGPFPALNANTADFKVHTDDVPFDTDERAGVLTLGLADADATESPRWGPTWSNEINEAGAFGGTLGVRVVYQAGYTTVPNVIQQYAAEAVKYALERFQTDSTLEGYSDGVLNFSPGQFLPLPKSVITGLSQGWMNRRA